LCIVFPSLSYMTIPSVTMQILNERLASYLEKVRSLEKANSELEVKIRQVLGKKCPDTKDYSHYQTTLDKLRKELQLRQYVETNINALRKLLDDTKVARLHLENDVKGLKVKLIKLKKQHQLVNCQNYSQINRSGVQVDVNAPNGQDLAKIMEKMRANYEKIILKNQEELKTWHESKITIVQVQVTENMEALKEAKTQVSVSRRQMQLLETELQFLIGNKAYMEEVEQYNGIILLRESELKQLRADIQSQTLEYQVLFNIKMELQAEIATYRRLLSFILFVTYILTITVLFSGKLDLDVTKIFYKLGKESIRTTLQTTTQTLVDGKIVSSSSSTIKK
uniref:Keratin 18a, tandem duplicate 2 n=1 Tax=Cyprinus carpio carpio TaxID=630221 RepID=A0A8C1HQK1_CYPCA